MGQGDLTIFGAPLANARKNRTVTRRFIKGLSQVERADGSGSRWKCRGLVLCDVLSALKCKWVLRGAQNERRGAGMAAEAGTRAAGRLADESSAAGFN
jgi:hypothetical protein